MAGVKPRQSAGNSSVNSSASPKLVPFLFKDRNDRVIFESSNIKGRNSCP